jgi:transcriptional regulator with XRE-family HTH domain
MKPEIDDAREFWNRVDFLRGKDKLTDIASTVGVDYELIRVQRSRHRIPSIKVCVKLAKVLNSTVEYLATGTAEPDHNDPLLNTVISNRQLYSIVSALSKMSSEKLEALSELLGISKTKVQKEALL